MTLEERQQGSLLANQELFSLAPSSVVSLFEIDITNVVFETGLINVAQMSSNELIFRFHNNINTRINSIFWQDNEYLAVPIKAEGFEFSTQGTMPTPKLSISVNDEGIPAMTYLKQRMLQLGDIVGAQVTRIRTFAKYLDAKNYPGNSVPFGYLPNPNVELARDIFYIERKSNENRYTLEYELASLLDLEGIQLPGRRVLANRCSHTYRGRGCLYEYQSRHNYTEHGDATLLEFAGNHTTVNDERISAILERRFLNDKGEWKFGTTYFRGDAVFIQKNNVKYYFVCKINRPTVGPPNATYWISDQCSKTVRGCSQRFGDYINFGGFPATVRIGV
jgi:lambda family phage minor tail protein L